MSRDRSAHAPVVSAEDRRLFTALGVLAVVVAVVAVSLWTATATASLLNGGMFLLPARRLIPTASAHKGPVGVVALIVFLALATPLVLAGVWLLHRYAPTTPGHASRADIRAELSADRARTTAVWTRPDLTDAQRRRVPVAELATPVHADEHHRPLWLPLENPSGVIAPTQSGKSRRDLSHKILAATGPVLVSTTKPDLMEWTTLARARLGGPVLLFDATGAVDWPAQVRWSPIQGCANPRTALRRARALVDASSVGMERGGGNEKVFRQRAYGVVRAYLVAAAISGLQVGDIVSWAISGAKEPEEILTDTHPDLAENLHTERGMVAETSDAVWMSVRKTIEPFMDIGLRELCSPSIGAGFDATTFIRDHGTLYIIAGEETAADAAPVLTALVDHIITTARDLATTTDYRRLAPVFTAILDELVTATPVPTLPSMLADSAGRGVLIHWAAQSRAQLEHAYGEAGTRALLDNTTALTVFGGLKDEKTLSWVAKLCEPMDEVRQSRSSGGMLSGTGQTTSSLQRLPLYEPAGIRGIDRDRVLIIFRHLDPILGWTTDVSRRRDAAELEKDRDAVIAGTTGIDRGGYLAHRIESPLMSIEDGDAVSSRRSNVIQLRKTPWSRMPKKAGELGERR